jgi:hypothetical protein
MSKHRRKRSGDGLLGDVMGVGATSIGVVGVTGMAGKLSESMPSSSSGKILEGMGSLSMLPTIQSTGVVFKQLKRLKKMK